MRAALFLLSLAVAAVASPVSVSSSTDCSSQCSDVTIPITVSVARFVVTADIETNWDAASLTFNLTRRDSGSAADPLPVADSKTNSERSTFNVSATICGKSDKFLVLTHGILESKLYWQPNFPGSDKYNFMQAAVAAGYSVISYDRIGVGASSTINSQTEAQFQVETAVLNSLVSYARKTLHAKKVAMIGHSYGSYLTTASASQVDVDAIALTGFGGGFSYFGPFLAGAGLRVANIHDSFRWGHLDSGYLTAVDMYATSYVYFTAPYFDHYVAEWAHRVESEPFAVGELPSLLETEIKYENIKAPVLILQGQDDVSACGGNCVGVVNSTKTMFTGAKTVDIIDNLPAGHNLNFHHVAPKAFKMIFDFLRRQGV